MNNGWNTERDIAVTRIACTMAAALAAGFGLALDADALYTGCAALLATVCYVWSWWSNNNMTKAAQEAQRYLDSIKASEHMGEEYCTGVENEEPFDQTPEAIDDDDCA